MALITLFLGIFLLLSLIFFLICLSTLEIEIKELNFNSNNIKGKKIEDYLIYIRLRLLKKITWLRLIINDKQISKIKESKIINNETLKKVILRNEKEILKTENIKNIKQLEIDIDKFNLKMKIDMVDTMITSLLVALVSTLLSILLAKKIKKYKIEKYNYTITPIYKENIQIIISLNCIINVKMVHIINILYMLLKRRSVKYDERTSNRRAYVCRHE